MCTQCIWYLHCFKTFQNCSLLCTFGFYEISTVVMRISLTMANIVLIIISNIAHTVYIRLKAFWNFSKLQFVFHIFGFRNFYSCDAHHANYGKHSLNHHLQHCAHSVYQIYSVLNLFKITVCFTHFGFYEISTPVVRIMLRQNSFNHHFQHCAHSVYQIYGVLKLFEITLCFAHFGFYEISTPVMGPMETVVNIVQVIISDIGHTV